jgi:hypothetical protein
MVGKHGYFHGVEYNREVQNLPDNHKNWYNPAAVIKATIAQSVEQTFRKRQVKSSNLFGGSPPTTIFAHLKALMCRALAFNGEADSRKATNDPKRTCRKIYNPSASVSSQNEAKSSYGIKSRVLKPVWMYYELSRYLTGLLGFCTGWIKVKNNTVQFWNSFLILMLLLSACNNRNAQGRTPILPSSQSTPSTKPSEKTVPLWRYHPMMSADYDPLLAA